MNLEFIEREKMKLRNAWILLLGIGLLTAGWASAQPLPQGGKGESRPGSESADSRPAGPAEGTEASIALLRSEVERLREEVALLNQQLKSLDLRRSVAFYKLPRDVTLCGERVPTEDRKVWEHLDREFILALNSEAQVLLWMKRARRYFPAIEKRLREMELPDDLKYLAITESSLRPSAVSSSGAAGLWQFIPSTGDRYGMRKGRGFDERFDVLKATEGALAYLRNLYGEFQNWAIAMAAYNAGENRVRKEIELQKMTNYYYLSLPAETERYVYKIIAAKMILSDPERYGFRLDEGDRYDPLRFERIEVELSQPLSLVEVARAVGSYYKEMREMNPHLSEENIPPGTHILNLPPGTTGRFGEFYSVWKRGLEGK